MLLLLSLASSSLLFLSSSYGSWLQNQKTFFGFDDTNLNLRNENWRSFVPNRNDIEDDIKIKKSFYGSNWTPICCLHAKIWILEIKKIGVIAKSVDYIINGILLYIIEMTWKMTLKSKNLFGVPILPVYAACTEKFKS